MTTHRLPESKPITPGHPPIQQNGEPPFRPHGTLTWRLWPVDPAIRQAARAAMSQVRLRGVPESVPPLGDVEVLVLGEGAVGGGIFESLVRLGVGRLSGVDPDLFGEDSFLTQPCSWEDAGQAKSDVHGRRASRVNPAVEVRTAVGLAQDVPLAVLRRARLWIAAGDNLELMVWLGQKAAELGKVLLQGAVHPETLTAIVRAYDLRNPAGPCPACAMTASESGNLRAIEGCAGLNIQPTRALPAVCGTAAQLTAAEAAKWLLGMEPMALAGAEYSHCLLTHRGWRTRLGRDPACGLPHRRWEQVDLATTAEQTSPAMLAAQLGVRGPTFELHMTGETNWCSLAICNACGRREPLLRFGRAGEAAGQCGCGGTLRAAPQGLHRIVPADELADVWDRSLASLGVAVGGAIGLTLEESPPHYFFTRDDGPLNRSAGK